MNIPYSRVLIPALVIVLAVTVYILIANPFSGYFSSEKEGDPSAVSQATIQDYRTRANEHLEKKEYQQALELLLKLEVMVPEDVAVHYAVARLYQSSDRRAEARAALERGIPYLNDSEANEAYAKLLSELDQGTIKKQ